MKTTALRWLKIFFKSSLIFAVGFAMLAAVSKGILAPALAWISNDIWQWMPFNRWLSYTIGGACIGIMTGAFFTTYAWFQHTSVSLYSKTLTAFFVITTTFFCMFAAAWVIKFSLPV